MQAVTLAVDVETGLAGHVRPYDTVRIVSAEGASAGEAFLETARERARVVAVGDDSQPACRAVPPPSRWKCRPRKLTRCAKPSSQGRVSLVLVAADDAFEEVGADGQDD